MQIDLVKKKSRRMTALSGDAGNRTPVRREDHQNIYIYSFLLTLTHKSRRKRDPYRLFR